MSWHMLFLAFDQVHVDVTFSLGQLIVLEYFHMFEDSAWSRRYHHQIFMVITNQLPIYVNSISLHPPLYFE